MKGYQEGIVERCMEFLYLETECGWKEKEGMLSLQGRYEH